MTEKKTTQKEKDPRMEEAYGHMKAAGENVHQAFESMLPPAVRDHQRAARKEFLLGLRSILDVAIEHVEPSVK
jgi:hypothetical protein